MTFAHIDYHDPAAGPVPDPAADLAVDGSPLPPGPRLVPSVRSDGWTGEKQRRFLEAVGDGATVRHACRAAGMSEASAYAFRRRAAGQAFALGWAGANLLARDRVAEDLFVRASEGQEVSITRADGSVTVRHQYDNRLALTLLARLDRYADAAASGEAGRTARLVAAEFDAYLDLVGEEGGPARAAAFLRARGKSDANPVAALTRADRMARCGAALAEDVPMGDLDPGARDRWTAEQWARAEAAGLVRLSDARGGQAETARGSQLLQLVPADEPVWWCDLECRWLTSFPPGDDFVGGPGAEQGEPGKAGYWRYLSDDEEELVREPELRERDALVAESAAERDRWFARLRAELEDEDAHDREHGAVTDESINEVDLARDVERDPVPDTAPAGRSGGDACASVPDACTLPTIRAFRGFQSGKQEPPMADTGNDITVLNTLIKTVNDSIQGYQESAKDIGNQRLASMFQDRAMERQKVATMLQAEVGRLGGDPSDGGSLLGSAHQIFLDMKSAITGKDDDAILAEVNRGEEYLRDKFDTALADADLGSSTRDVIGQAAQSVRQGADSVRGFNNAM